MRFAIIVGNTVTEPADIPTPHEGDPYAWLKKQFPTLGNWQGDPTGGWKHVSNDAVPGATYKGPGDSTNPAPPAPPPPPPPKAVAITLLAFLRLCQSAGGMTDDMLVDCDADPLFKAFWIKFRIAREIEAADVDTKAGLAALAGAGYLPKGAQAVLDAWPKA